MQSGVTLLDSIDGRGGAAKLTNASQQLEDVGTFGRVLGPSPGVKLAEIGGEMADGRRRSWLAVDDREGALCESVLKVHHLVENAAQSPDVHLLGDVIFVPEFDALGRAVDQGSRRLDLFFDQ